MSVCQAAAFRRRELDHAFQKRLRLSGILLSLARSVGLIIAQLAEAFPGLYCRRLRQKEPDKPDTITIGWTSDDLFDEGDDELYV